MPIPWKLICKIGGAALLGTASVLGAMESDKKTQEVIKKLAEKSTDFIGKKS